MKGIVHPVMLHLTEWMGRFREPVRARFTTYFGKGKIFQRRIGSLPTLVEQLPGRFQDHFGEDHSQALGGVVIAFPMSANPVSIPLVVPPLGMVEGGLDIVAIIEISPGRTRLLQKFQEFPRVRMLGSRFHCRISL